MTIRDFYRHFVRTYGVITTAVTAIPFISFFFPDKISRYIFPPLTDTLDVVVKVVSIIFVLSVTLLVYNAKDELQGNYKQRRLIIMKHTFLISLISFVLYIFSNILFVRTIEIDKINDSHSVSVGFIRSGFADTTYKNAVSDYEMLKSYGFEEENIQELWSPFSIAVSRILLLVFYLTFLLSIIAVCSYAVLFDLFDILANLHNKINTV